LYLEQLLAGPSGGGLKSAGSGRRGRAGPPASGLDRLLDMEPARNGLDFLFTEPAAAAKFVEFVSTVLPVRLVELHVVRAPAMKKSY
jgi:hypothetical protein